MKTIIIIEAIAIETQSDLGAIVAEEKFWKEKKGKLRGKSKN